MTFFPKFFSSEKFNLLHWNCNSIKHKYVELSHALNNYNIQICSLNETKLSSKSLFKIHNYKIYRNDRDSRGGGVAIILRNNIKHSQLAIPPLKSLEAVGVTVYFKNYSLNIISVYKPPSLKLCKLDLKKLFLLNSKTIILGDFILLLTAAEIPKLVKFCSVVLQVIIIIFIF